SPVLEKRMKTLIPVKIPLGEQLISEQEFEQTKKDVVSFFDYRSYGALLKKHIPQLLYSNQSPELLASFLAFSQFLTSNEDLFPQDLSYLQSFITMSMDEAMEADRSKTGTLVNWVQPLMIYHDWQKEKDARFENHMIIPDVIQTNPQILKDV